MKQSDLLDQYYTKPKISKECLLKLKALFKDEFWQNKTFLEPSAGSGSFIDSAKEVFGSVPIAAYDLEAKRNDIVQADFLVASKLLNLSNCVTIGNPPFGKRSKLAIEFLNICAEKTDVVAFILPVQFLKYGVQSKLNKNLKLIYSEILDPNSFTKDSHDCSIRCVFQVWTKFDTDHLDLRIKNAPSTKHPDFEMFLHNNTSGTLKYFDKNKYKWDFAVPRQGYYNFNERITDENKLKKNVQYLFFKANNDTVLERLKKLNLEELSKKNTTTPGFGKADVVELYMREYE